VGCPVLSRRLEAEWRGSENSYRIARGRCGQPAAKKDRGKKKSAYFHVETIVSNDVSARAPVNEKNAKPAILARPRCLQNFTNATGTIEEFSVTDAPRGASRTEMQRKPFLRLALAGSLCAVALFASDFWKNKDSTQWSSDEVSKMLTDSPWAKEITVTSGQQNQQRRGGGRRGGMGGGFPGGGGGGGYPGGGGGYPGGSGGGGGGYGGGINEKVVLRWDSALPIQQALHRQGYHAAASDDASKDKDASKPAVDINQKYYVVSILGLTLPSRRGDSDSSDSDRQSADDLRSRFLDAATLMPKSKIAIQAEDVQFEGRNGSIAMRFLFPRTFPIGEEKEITFQFQSQGVKFEHKFKVTDMQYQGKSAL